MGGEDEDPEKAGGEGMEVAARRKEMKGKKRERTGRDVEMGKAGRVAKTRRREGMAEE